MKEVENPGFLCGGGSAPFPQFSMTERRRRKFLDLASKRTQKLAKIVAIRL